MYELTIHKPGPLRVAAHYLLLRGKRSRGNLPGSGLVSLFPVGLGSNRVRWHSIHHINTPRMYFGPTRLNHVVPSLQVGQGNHRIKFMHLVELLSKVVMYLIS